MRITMLGTGNALVTECYNTCFVVSDGDRYMMVDGGGGNTVLHQLKHAGLKWQDMRDIFVTHKHVDHIMGIIWMVRMICQNMAAGKYEGEANIYGHEEVIRLVKDISCSLLQPKQTKYIGDRLHLITVEDGEKRSIMGHDVTFFDIRSTKAKQFGFVMETDKGRITCCGDEPFAPHERQYAEGAYIMLHEAFCMAGQADVFKPYEKNHSTVKDACELAEELGVKNLILYHTEDANIAERRELYTAEGSQYYNGKIYVPYDLETMEF